MIRQHLSRHLSQEQRRRWVSLLLETADELRLPEDPEFRSALVGYLEWGSRLAVLRIPVLADSQFGNARIVDNSRCWVTRWRSYHGPMLPTPFRTSCSDAV